MTTPRSSLKMFYVFARVLLFYALSVIIFATASGFTKELPFADYISLAVSSLLTLTLIVLFTKWEKVTLPEVGIAFQRQSTLRFLSGFGVGIVMVAVQAIITAGFAEVSFVLSPDVSIITIAPSLILYLLVALREELVFRSYSIRSLANSISPIVALITITIIFILEHVMAGVSWKMSVIGSGFGGILFGVAALKTKGIALPLGIHSAWNFTQWMLGFKNDTGIWREVVKSGHESAAENIALSGFVIAMSLAIVSLLVFYQKKKL
jgi:membrane protease YdiL (CAAX protease family)